LLNFLHRQDTQSRPTKASKIFGSAHNQSINKLYFYMSYKTLHFLKKWMRGLAKWLEIDKSCQSLKRTIRETTREHD